MGGRIFGVCPIFDFDPFLHRWPKLFMVVSRGP